MSEPARFTERVETVTGARPVRHDRLPGGCVADVRRVRLTDGRAVVAKIAPEGGLTTEAFMLSYLAAHSPLPVPDLLLDHDDLLLLELLDGGDRLDAAAEADAARHMAALHATTGRAFGLERDTLIGPLHQPNPRTERWVDFFRDHRLLEMTRRARDAGVLQPSTQRVLERLAAKLEQYIVEPPAPALLHGDAWTGNILVKRGRIAGFVDPAIYFGDPEIELAFTTLFGTFGDAFFQRYAALAGMRDGFFEVRRDLYNLYPLLVHAVLFGAGFTHRVHRTAERYA